MLSFIAQYLFIWKPLGYLLAFFSMMLEGEFLMLTFVYFTSLGYFNAFYMFLTLISGALIGDLLWYWFGEYLFRVHHHRFPEWLHRLIHPLDRHLLDRPDRVIFISKFAYGTNHATLMRAGALRIELKKFLKSNFYANLLWVSAVGGLGYLFAASLPLIRKYLRFAEIAVLGAAILFLAVSHIVFTKYAGGKEDNNNEKNNNEEK